MTLVHRKTEKARGERRKSFVRLDGQTGTEQTGNLQAGSSIDNARKFPVTYELEWDPKTDHLAGTRNGAPVRFIRAELAPVNQSDCKPAQ